MAPKKIMLWPSARSRFVKDGNMEIIYKSLVVLAVLIAVQQYYLFGFMYGVKVLLMAYFSVLVTREVEILFYTHDKDITRDEAKTLIKKSYYRVTALLYALLIPIGTPLWLVALGAALATILGKLLFGGFHHMVFHSSLVGVIVVTLGWNDIGGVAFMTSFDNYILELLFDHPFFNETLAIGNVFDPSVAQSALAAVLSGDSYDTLDVFIGLTPGIIGSALILLPLGAYFMWKKVVDWKIPVVALLSFLFTALIVGVVRDENPLFALYYLFSGSFLFVAVFIMTDPITTPLPLTGKIIFGVIVGSLTVFIRLAGVYDEGVIFAVLFMNMLTPLLNEVFKVKKKAKKAPVKKAGVSA